MGYSVGRTYLKLPAEQAEAHNRQLAGQIARIAKTQDEVGDICLDVAGHLSILEHYRFRDLAMDAWFAYNVSKICAEVESEYR